jgi:hypothetical protein
MTNNFLSWIGGGWRMNKGEGYIGISPYKQLPLMDRGGWRMNKGWRFVYRLYIIINQTCSYHRQGWWEVYSFKNYGFSCQVRRNYASPISHTSVSYLDLFTCMPNKYMCSSLCIHVWLAKYNCSSYWINTWLVTYLVAHLASMLDFIYRLKLYALFIIEKTETPIYRQWFAILHLKTCLAYIVVIKHT